MEQNVFWQVVRLILLLIIVVNKYFLFFNKICAEIILPPLQLKTWSEEDINKFLCKEDKAGTASYHVPPKLRTLHLTIKDKFSTSEEKWKDKCHDVMVT